jgi:hypothetical protein
MGQTFIGDKLFWSNLKNYTAKTRLPHCARRSNQRVTAAALGAP